MQSVYLSLLFSSLLFSSLITYYFLLFPLITFPLLLYPDLFPVVEGVKLLTERPTPCPESATNYFADGTDGNLYHYNPRLRLIDNTPLNPAAYPQGESEIIMSIEILQSVVFNVSRLFNLLVQ